LFYRDQLSGLFNEKDGKSDLGIENFLSNFESKSEGLKVLSEALLRDHNKSDNSPNSTGLGFLRNTVIETMDGSALDEIDNETKFKLIARFLDVNEVAYGIPNILVDFIKSVDVSEVPDCIKFKIDEVFLRETYNFYKLDRKFREIFLYCHKESIEGSRNNRFNFDPGVYIHQHTYKRMVLDDPSENHLYDFITKHFNPNFKFPPQYYIDIDNVYFQLLHGYLKDYPLEANQALMKLFIYPKFPTLTDKNVVNFAEKHLTMHGNNLKNLYEKYIDNLWSKAREIVRNDEAVNDENYQSKYYAVFDELKYGNRKAKYTDKKAQEIYEFFAPKPFIF